MRTSIGSIKAFGASNRQIRFFLIALAGASFLSVRDASRRILSQTPGNLIYDKLED